MVGCTLAMTSSAGVATAPVSGAAGSFTLTSVTASTRTLNITANSSDATTMDTDWPAAGILYFESNGTITQFGVGGFCAMKAMSTRNHEPQRASRPFDKDRDGFVMGEGAGIVVLEELEHARARGATILAELVGYALTNDAGHDTAPAPGGAGAVRCMRLGLKSAGIDPTEVLGEKTAEFAGLVEGHGDNRARIKRCKRNVTARTLLFAECQRGAFGD
jgi:hypothetical protein